MTEIRRDVLDAPGATTLAWVDGTLYDIADGWRSFPLDGSRGSSRFSRYGRRFDAVTVSPRGDVVALIASSGTKALLLDRDGRPLREVDRSYYHADAYRYPLALFTMSDGRTGLVHCPDKYNRLEIEDAVTGERLTAGAERHPGDFFHSRLAVAPSGRFLLSAGWVWHPWGCLAVYDLPRATVLPSTLDSPGDILDMRDLVEAEVAGACFAGDDVVISTSAEEDESEGPLAPTTLARWSADTGTFAWRRRLDLVAGDLVPLGGDILALHGHPRLYSATTGDLLGAWPDLPTGDADSSIVWDKAFSGPARVAVDPTGRRFAITDGERITVVHLG